MENTVIPDLNGNMNNCNDGKQQMMVAQMTGRYRVSYKTINGRYEPRGHGILLI